MKNEKFTVDRKAFSVVSLKEQENEERTYWWDKTPQKRLEALETTRQIIYGYNPATERFQRVFEVVKRS